MKLVKHRLESGDLHTPAMFKLVVKDSEVDYVPMYQVTFFFNHLILAPSDILLSLLDVITDRSK